MDESVLNLTAPALAEENEEAFWTALHNLSMNKLARCLLLFVAGYLLIQYLTRLTGRLLERKKKLDASVQGLITTSLRVGLLFLLVMTCADQLGLPTTSVLTVLGTLGLALSLAMQSSLANLAGGVFLLGSKPFQTGDYISLPGAEGTVARIGFIHTTLTTVDNRQIHVPNSAITGSTVVNYSQNPTRRLELTIPVPYECALERAKAVIAQVVEQDPRITEPPFIRVWELSESSVDILVRVWCAREDYWELRASLLEGIKLALDREGIAIPYRQLEVRWRDGKPRD